MEHPTDGAANDEASKGNGKVSGNGGATFDPQARTSKGEGVGAAKGKKGGRRTSTKGNGKH